MDQESTPLSDVEQVIIFRSRLRADIHLAEVEVAGAQMYALVTAMPGFNSVRIFNAKEGESLTFVEVENEKTLLDWRDHPNASEARLGRSRAQGV